jgi:hypothetical protein
MPSRPWSIEELSAGDARRLRVEHKTTPNGDTDLRVAAHAAASAGGDLDAAAVRLGVAVADLVAIRALAGFAPAHRRPGFVARLFRRFR